MGVNLFLIVLLFDRRYLKFKIVLKCLNSVEIECRFFMIFLLEIENIELMFLL